MHRLLAALSFSALAGLVTMSVPAAAQAADPVPIRGHQYFEGLVNKHAPRGVIRVGCAGPATTGHPLRGQTVEVDLVVPPVTADQGYTGTAARRIRAWLVWPTAAATAPARIATFASYSVAMPIPTTIKVPCSGKGKMIFVPAPGSRTARRAFVIVRFRTRGV